MKRHFLVSGNFVQQPASGNADGDLDHAAGAILRAGGGGDLDGLNPEQTLQVGGTQPQRLRNVLQLKPR